MNSSTAKHVGEIVGLGLATNYIDHAVAGHPRNTNRKGGLTPALAKTGDKQHDLAMQGGRLALHIGISWILVHVWVVYAAITAVAVGSLFHTTVMLLPNMTAAGVWLGLQLLYLLFWARVFDGRKAKRHERVEMLPPSPPRPRMSLTFMNDWGEPIPVAWHSELGCFIDAWGRPFSVYNRAA